MRTRRIALILFASLLGLAVLQQPASADCAGPTLTHENGEFAPGDLVNVTGMWFGDNCYDTGPPPEGEGDLGVPIPDIEVLVRQGEREWVVATGNTDAEYGWMVDITLPPDLDPGPAMIAARFGDTLSGNEAYLAPTEELVITDAAPTGAFSVATFDPTLNSPDPEVPPADAPEPEIEVTPVEPEPEVTGAAASETAEIEAQEAAEVAANEAAAAESRPANRDSSDSSSVWILLGVALVGGLVGGLVVYAKR